MADGFDGEIRLGVKLTPTDVKKTASQLQQEIEKIFNASAGQKTSKQFQQMEIRLDSLYNKSQKFQESLKQMEATKIPTEEYKEITKQIEDAHKKLDAFRAAEEKAKEIGKPLKGDRLRAMQYEVAQLENTIEYAKGDLQDLVDTGKAFTLGSDTQKYKDTAKQLNGVNNEIVKTISATEALQQQEEELPEPVQRTSQAAEHLNSSMSKVGSLISKVLHGLGNVSKTLGGKIVSATKKLVGHFSKLGHHTDKHQLSLKKMVRMMLKYGLGIRSVFILWRKLRSYATEALKTMATQFDDVNADISMLMNSFNQMKNSIGTMVQPLLHALAPALNYIISLIASAATALANFFAILTGQKYIYKATKQNDDYADSLGGVGGAAKEANKELGEYDNLLVIKSQNEGSGGGGGADAGAGLFEKVEAESDLAEQIKDAIAKGDWEGVGSEFADRLNVITDRFDTWINTKFRPAGEKWAVRIARILNGFTDRVNGKKMGKTLADAFNSAFSIVNKFLTNYDFKKLGIRIADFGSGFVQNIDPTLIGKTFANKINAGLKLISGLITFDWRTLGSRIGTNISAFFKTTDWQLAGEDFSGLAHGILTTLGTAIETTDFGAIGDALVNFLNKIDFEQIAGDLSKLATNILDALGKVNWVEVGGAVGHAIGTFLNGIDFGKIGVSLLELAGKIAAGIASAFLQLVTDSTVEMLFGTAIVALIKSAKIEKSALESGVGTALSNATGGGSLSISSPMKVLLGIELGLAGGKLFSYVYAWVCEQLGFEQYANEVRYYLKHPVEVIASISDLSVPAADRLTGKVADKMKAVIEEALSKGFSVDEIKALIGYDELDEATAQLVDRIFLDIKAGNAKIKEDVQETGTNVERSLGKAGTNITTKVNQTVSDVKKAWDKQDLSNHFTDVANGIEDSFDNVPKNLTDTFTTAKTDVENVWNQNDVSDYFTARSTDVNNAFSQLPSELGVTFSDTLSQVKMSFAEDSLTNHFTSVKDNIEGAFTNLPTFFGTTFEDSWNTVQEAFSNGSTVFGEFNTGISESMTSTVNGLITGLNSVVSKPFQAINDALSRLRNLKFGASGVFSSLPIFSNIPQIPKLAQGAVIPPNREFLAMLGDQSSGTNIETPLNTMIEAFTKALDARQSSSNNAPIVLQLNSKVVAQAVWDEEDKKYKQTGRR